MGVSEKLSKYKYLPVMAAVMLVVAAGGIFAVNASKKRAPACHRPIEQMVKLINEQGTQTRAYYACVAPPFDAELDRALYRVLRRSDLFKEQYEAGEKELADFYAGLGEFRVTEIEYLEEDQWTPAYLAAMQSNADAAYFDRMQSCLKRLESWDRHREVADRWDLTESDVRELMERLRGYYTNSLEDYELEDAYYITFRLHLACNGQAFVTRSYKAEVFKQAGVWYLSPHMFCQDIFQYAEPENADGIDHAIAFEQELMDGLFWLIEEPPAAEGEWK